MFGYKPPVTFLEWLMGYPLGHTGIELKESETPSCRKLRSKSSQQSQQSNEAS